MNKGKEVNIMVVKFTNYQGANRKPLVKAIEEITGLKGQYTMKAPTQFAYIFENERATFILAKDGTLTIDGEVVTRLEEAGFTGEVEKDDGDTITIEIPKNGTMSDEKVQNLLRLAESRHRLFTKALGRPLIINDAGNTVQFVFPFTDEVGIGGIYAQLAHAMVRYVKKHSRVTAVEREVTSEKFSMRTFLLKLGMIGSQYSDCRKWFCRNLSGNASFATDEKYVEMQNSRRKSAVAV